MFNLFKQTDERIFNKLGKIAYIRNGVGYGFVSDEFLYNNALLEIGIGRTSSGKGDWGGGFDTATTSPLKITIDKNYNILKVETHSFYNSSKSKQVEKVAKRIKSRLGKKFHVKNDLLKTAIDRLFAVLPVKNHIGLDINLSNEEGVKRMIEYFSDKTKADYYSGLPNAECQNE